MVITLSTSAGQASNKILNDGQIFSEVVMILLDAISAKNIVDNIVNLGVERKATSAHTDGGKIILTAGEHGQAEIEGLLSASAMHDEQSGGHR